MIEVIHPDPIIRLRMREIALITPCEENGDQGVYFAGGIGSYLAVGHFERRYGCGLQVGHLQYLSHCYSP